MRLRFLTAGLLLCAACVTPAAVTPASTLPVVEPVPAPLPPVVEPAPVAEEPPTADPSESVRAQIIERARSLVGTHSLRKVTHKVPDDCSGFVRLVFGEVGIELMGQGRAGENAVTAIWRLATMRDAFSEQSAQPGDVVFFRETYDRNRDGRRNDGLTHVGIVEEVHDDGTVLFIHRGHHGIERSRFNLQSPTSRRTDDGTVLNDYLRPSSKHLRAYTAGELFAGSASVSGLR